MAESRIIEVSSANGKCELQSAVAFEERFGLPQARTESGVYIDRGGIVQAAAHQGLWVRIPSYKFYDAREMPTAVTILEGGDKWLFDSLFSQPYKFVFHPDEENAGLTIQQALAYRGEI